MTRRGVFVVVVGPDGTGKTTLARNLIARWPSSTVYVHFRPSISKRPDSAPGDETVTPPPKRKEAGPQVAGWLRLAWSVLIFNIGYWRWLQPALRQGALIVGDRWIYGYLAQPHSLGFAGPRWLARLAVNLIPRPDLIVRLRADPLATASRKHDLSPSEVEIEDSRWDNLQPRPVVVDANQPAERVADDVIIEVQRRLDPVRRLRAHRRRR